MTEAWLRARPVGRQVAHRPQLRPLVEEDIPAVAGLHQRVFGCSQRTPVELEAILRQIFCGHPWRDPRLPSLVYEEQGELCGCLGVMPRPMWLGDEPVVAAVGHNFMVDPRSRHTLVGIEMLRAFFAGPQDLSLAEGNDTSRQLWRALGGSVAALYSLRWTRPLRPLTYGLSVATRHGLTRRGAACLKPLCSLLDHAGRRLAGPRTGGPANGITVEPLASRQLLDCIERFGRRVALRPRYTEATLAWLLDAATDPPRDGELRRRLARHRGEIAGWFVYQLGPSRVAEVLQLGVVDRWAGDVVEQLFCEAHEQGAIAVSGQLEPSLLAVLSEELCLFHRSRRGSWILAHSRRPEVLQALHPGDAFLSRLEGEWWIGHRLAAGARTPGSGSRFP